MTEQYQKYLDSEEWKQKRQQRLAISDGKCSCCRTSQRLQVHHLTYERIFNEEMADLLPLCEDCHKKAEHLIAQKKLSRMGNVLFLSTETIRLILELNRISPPTPKKQNPTKPTFYRENTGIALIDSLPANNSAQAALLSDMEFISAAMRLDRKTFKRCPYVLLLRGKRRANAFTLYDRLTKWMKAHKTNRFSYRDCRQKRS